MGNISHNRHVTFLSGQEQSLKVATFKTRFQCCYDIKIIKFKSRVSGNLRSNFFLLFYVNQTHTHTHTNTRALQRSFFLKTAWKSHLKPWETNPFGVELLGVWKRRALPIRNSSNCLWPFSNGNHLLPWKCSNREMLVQTKTVS